MTDESQVYVIFARKAYDQPLAELGTVSASDLQEVQQAALEGYPDDDWLEMIAIPQAVVVPVIEGSSA